MSVPVGAWLARESGAAVDQTDLFIFFRGQASLQRIAFQFEGKRGLSFGGALLILKSQKGNERTLFGTVHN